MKHLLDTRTRHHGPGRLQNYLTLERRERVNGLHHAINVLRRQPRGATGAARLKAFVALERAKQAS